MTLKINAKFEKKLTLGSINDEEFYELESLKICTLMRYFCQ